MRYALAVLVGLGALALACVFREPRSWAALAVLLVGAVALWKGSRRWVQGFLALVGLLFLWAPGPGLLRLNPFNLVAEPDLVRTGLLLFFPEDKARIESFSLPLYHQPPEATATWFTATDIVGLGTGAGHHYSHAVPGQPLLVFLHGALGNFQSYRAHWLDFQPGQWTVVCPTFGNGWWWKPGGTETALAAVDAARARTGAPAGGTLLAGMSNGATGAVRAVAARPEEFAALVLISPVLEPERVTDPAFVAWGRTHPVLVVEGDQDVNVRPESVEHGVELMQREGVQVTYRLLPGHDHFLMFSARPALFQALSGVVPRRP